MANNLVTKTIVSGILQDDLQRLLKPLGGMRQFINQGETVLLKPNFNTSDPYPASTSLDFLEAVIMLIKSTGATKIIVGDSCTITQNTTKVMDKLGVFDLGKRLSVEIIDFDKGKFITKEINGEYLKSVRVPAVIDEVDKIITLPCLKVHRLARFTMSLKICVGFMKKITRIKLHTGGNLEAKIAELNLTYKPNLIILDGRKAFITNGPESGEVVSPNTMLAGTDRVAVDLEALKVLKSFPAVNKLTSEPNQLTTIKHAQEIGIGNSDYQLINV